MSWYSISEGAFRQSASGELVQPRCPGDDLSHLIRTNFVAAEPEKFMSGSFDLDDAETEAHQPGSGRHDAAAHQSGEAAALDSGRDGVFRARNPVDQRLNFVGRTLAAQETQHNAHGVFSDSIIDAGFRGQLPNQFVHIAPPSTGETPASSKKHLELPCIEIQATTVPESAIHDQSRCECCSNARTDVKSVVNIALKRVHSDFRRTDAKLVDLTP